MDNINIRSVFAFNIVNVLSRSVTISEKYPAFKSRYVLDVDEDFFFKTHQLTRSESSHSSPLMARFNLKENLSPTPGMFIISAASSSLSLL